ncbi:MAG: sulfite exporter TauE/SafE family protein [Patescibacteria group bacterium]|nr:sulfite exporter TauE/SafE family protein [Patescibacteria group bacterium]
MGKTIVPVKGMHCRSCELLIEGKLKEIPGIKGIAVSYKKKQAEFFLNDPATMNKVADAIYEAGYEIGREEKSWISKNPTEYKDLGIALVILAILYLVAKKFNLTNLNFGNTNNPSSLIVVLLVGLTAGVSTCMALVGGLILGISARHSEKHPEASAFQKFRPHLFFNLGRILSYFILGGLIGTIGKAFQLSSSLLGALTIIVGIFMLILGIQLTELFPRISSTGFTLPSGLAKLFGIKKRHEREYSHTNSLVTGALTFFLPCGFTQAMQLYAMSTGNFWSGAAIMGVFALGTAPGLLGIGGLTSVIKGAFAKKFFKFAGVLVIFLAILNISNGFNLTGWRGISFNNSTVSAKDDPNVKIENGVQIVKMTQNSYGYTPNNFTIKKDIPVKWVITSEDARSCAASIVASKINVKKFLSAGENIISFTPTEFGEIKFSCSMGMYTGKFTVVENEDPKTITLNSSATPTPTKSNNEIPPLPPDAQVITTTFISPKDDISPKEFTVQFGKPVRFQVEAKEDGRGCMSTITVPGLVDRPQFIEKDKTIVFDFTPKEKGTYYITCSMGSVRGRIIVN